MNMKQSCKALICAIEGELDGRHCTEEQAASILDHALPSLTEALARVEAERDSLMDTYVALAEKLGIDLESARKAPGKPSDVFVAYIQAERDTAQARLAEAVTLLRKLGSLPHAWQNDQVAINAFLTRHAQTEQQEAQGAQAVEFQREDRYLVIKRKDLALLSPTDRDLALTLMGELSAIMATWNVPERQYLVIEGDWPEYEPTWAAIQARVVFADRRQVRDISEEEKKAIADRLKSLPPALRGNDHDQ